MERPHDLPSFAGDRSSDVEMLVPEIVRPGQYSKFFKLTVIVFLCIVILGASFGLFLLFKGKSHDTGTADKSAASTTSSFITTEPAWPTEQPISGTICNTVECRHSAEEVTNQINKAADPCNDFYEFACGGWIKRNPLTASKSSVSGFTVLNDDNMKVLKSALENAATNYSQNAAVMKTAKYYQTCVDTETVQNQTAAPLQKLIRNLGGWSLSGAPNSFSEATLMGKVARELNVDTLLGLSVSVDVEDNTRHIIKLAPATLGMSYSYYVTYSAENLRIRAAYKTYLKKIAKLLGGGADSDSKMMKIYDFEEKLANIAEGEDPFLSLVEHLEELRQSGRSLLGVDKTIQEFCSKSGFSLRFIREFLNEAFKGIKSISMWDKVQALPDWYFEKLANYYSRLLRYHWMSDEIDTLKDYIIWRVVDRYASAMPSQFSVAKLEFRKAMMGPQTSQRWTDCINEMMTPLDMPLGLMFVDAHFQEDSKKTVIDLTRRIRTAFIDNLKNAQWMDQETKDGAKEKARAILEDIGYPSWIKDQNKLAQAYSELNVMEGNYFDSFKALSSFTRLKNFEDVDKTVNKDRWMNGPAQVNGYYSLQQNRIVFLAGIIQSPFYIPTRPRYMNYGGIGMVIGHEITHGFDGTGRLFDKNGQLKNWWSPSSEENFKERSQCLVDQYSNYEVFGSYIDGRQTLNENIADNGGIKLAYEAYQAWVRDNKPEGRLPGLGLSVDQLFFLGFARPWCSIYKRDAALLQLRVDSHTFNKYRVIGSLSNFDKFSKAYSCKKGTNMNPYSQCAVW